MSTGCAQFVTASYYNRFPILKLSVAWKHSCTLVGISRASRLWNTGRMLSRIISSVENPQRHFNFEPAKIPPPPPIVPSHRSPSFAYPPSSSSPALIHPLFSLGRRRRKFALNLSNGWVEEGQIANKRDIYIYILQIDIGRNASRISVDRVDIDGDGSISMGAIS